MRHLSITSQSRHSQGVARVACGVRCGEAWWARLNRANREINGLNDTNRAIKKEKGRDNAPFSPLPYLMRCRSAFNRPLSADTNHCRSDEWRIRTAQRLRVPPSDEPRQAKRPCSPQTEARILRSLRNCGIP